MPVTHPDTTALTQCGFDWNAPLIVERRAPEAEWVSPRSYGEEVRPSTYYNKPLTLKLFNYAGARCEVRGPTTWTVIRHDGPNHLGL